MVDVCRLLGLVQPTIVPLRAGLEQAAREDPTFALAYAGLADTFT